MGKFWRRTCAASLSTTMLVGLLQAAPGMQVYADEKVDQEFAELEAFFNETQSVVYSALYVPEENVIRVICDEIDMAGFDCYVRHNDNLQFTFWGSSETRAFDIPVDFESGYYDIRLTVDYEDGKEKTSGLLSMQLTDGKYEFVIRDSDTDGIEDGIEIWDFHTNPFQADTDGDGFTDGFEVYVLESDPLKRTKNKDSDKDGLSDLEEQEKGTNPYLPDSDFDGLSDAVDSEPLITDANSGYPVDYSVKINHSSYDKKFKFKNTDKSKYEVLYNQTTGNIKHMLIDKDKEVWMFVNSSNRLSVMISRFEDEISVDTYSYENGYLRSICHGGTIWRYEYDETGNLIQTEIGGRSICSNVYENGILQKTVYGNGQENEYLYTDDLKCMEAVRINGALSYQNQYDELGNVIKTYDYVNDICYDISYDNYGSVESVSTDNGFRIQYDSKNAMDRTVYQLDGSGTKENVISETDEGTHVVYSDGTVLDMLLDEDMQVCYQVKNITGAEITGYEAVREDDGIRIAYSDGTEYFYRIDNDGRLQSISENESILVSYEYDVKGQLVRSNIRENGETVLYYYDADYNLINAEHYAFTLDTPQQLLHTENYSYGDDSWTALLTEYNGQAIRYDEIGNPLEYLGAELGWDNGRLLASFDKADTHAEYQYDSQGIRIGKTVNGTKTSYYLDDKRIVAEKIGDEVIWYSYDSMGSPVSFEYQGATYYYQKNIYNDIVGIVDGEGNVLAQYSYDEWGDITGIYGDEELAQANKLRYRSYYYDAETGFYYLQSRYYDAQTGRFLNADEKFVTFNLFAYCSNDPVNYVDHTGHAATAAITYIVIGVIFATFALMMAYILQDVFLTLWLDYLKPEMDTLLTAVQATIMYPASQVATAIDEIRKKMTNVETYISDKLKEYVACPSYAGNYHIHHIVAKDAPQAAVSRDIYNKSGYSNIDDPINLVSIKAGVHQHLHTNFYYGMVELILRSVYIENSPGNKDRVAKKLDEIKAYLSVISNAAPF